MDLRLIPQLLPEAIQAGIQPGSALATIIAMMQSNLAPGEGVLTNLDKWFDPRRAPDPFVMMLAGWVGLERTLIGEPDQNSSRETTIDAGALRELTLRAVGFAQSRGTAGTLIAVLEISTGAKGFKIIENPPNHDGSPQSFHMRVEMPAVAARHAALIKRVVENWKPAFVTSEISIAGI